MTACPTEGELRCFLSGTLVNSSTETISSHIDQCANCQKALDLLTNDHNIDVIRESGSSTVNAPRDEFLEQLKSAPVEGAKPKHSVPTIAGYEMLDEIGRGGAGVVYRARQLALNRIVAIKVLLGNHGFEDERERFRIEALAAGRLNHPGIVRVHEVGEWTPQPGASPLPYVCLEYVGGGTLDRQIARKPRAPREAAGMVVQLANAVHAAHQAGIVHRDIKPANVLIDGVTGQLKIADFGLAKQVDLGVGNTTTGTILGTPCYMAPEQARGNTKAIDFRTDVYALGAVLYELLTGRPPFQGVTPIDTVLQVAEEEPIKPRVLQRSIPRDLETVCLKCLEKPASRRYESAEALGQDLNRFLAGKPTLARPVGKLSRAFKVARRHPLPTGLSAVLVVVILCSIGGLTHLYFQSDSARRDADKEREKAVEERNVAVAERAKANAAREGTQSIQDFLLDQLLEGAQLSNDGRKVTVLQMLEAASPKVATLFAKQPEIAASIHASLGATFQQYGVYDKAVFHFGESLRLRREVLGPHAEPTLQVQVQLATNLDALGQSDKAKPLLEDAVAGFKEIGLDASEPALRARMNLSNIARDKRQMPEAERWLVETLKLSREAYGAQASLTLEAELELAIVQGIMNGPASAIQPLRTCLKNTEEAFGPKSQPAVSVKGRLGEALLAAKQFDDAAIVLQEVLAGHRELVGLEHPTNFKTQAELADCWVVQKKLKEAEAAYREALAGFKKTMPADVSLIPNAMTRLGNCLIEQERFGEAEKLLLDAREKFKTAIHVPREWPLQNQATLETLYKRWKK